MVMAPSPSLILTRWCRKEKKAVQELGCGSGGAGSMAWHSNGATGEEGGRWGWRIQRGVG